LSLSATYDSVWISWITGNYELWNIPVCLNFFNL
jgi:hypothetical protein